MALMKKASKLSYKNSFFRPYNVFSDLYNNYFY